MPSQSVLVTGGAGFIGSHVAQRFEAAGLAVRVLDDLSSGSRANLSPTWDFVPGNINDPSACSFAVSGCDFVVHLAAFTSVPGSFERPEECTESNVYGTFNVLQACAAAGVRRLVFASSSAVYAELPDAPKRESELAFPISPYAVSKLEGEHLLEIFARRGLSCAALRFFNVFGPRQAADSDYAAAVPIFFERSLQAQPLAIYGDGRQTRDFVFVRDVADAIYCASQSRSPGVFNVGSGVATSVLELAEAIQKLVGADPDCRLAASRSGDLRSSTADLRKVEAQLGWRPRVSLAEGLSATLHWQRARQAPAPE